MLCPSCNGSSLKPIKLQDRLPARECSKCHGVLIDLLVYRAWADNTPSVETSGLDVEEANDNSKALVCPKCSKLMLKYRISGKQPNKVDICTHCDEAWLDHGEWALLGSLSLQEKLTAIFTEPWQRQIREEEIKLAQERRFEILLGSEDYKKLTAIKGWIDSHPKKDDLIRFLMPR